MGTKIFSTGYALPERIVTNKDLEKLFDTTDEWIVQRTGIKERRFCRDDQAASDLAYEAACKALQGIDIDEIGLVIAATTSADKCFPGVAALIQARLGFKADVGAADIQTQCSGFIYGLAMAHGLVKAGVYSKVLVVAVETLSKVLELNDQGRDTAVLFGDGAGAAVVGSDPASESDFLSVVLRARGRDADKLCADKPGSSGSGWITHEDIELRRHRIKMDGKSVFKTAVTCMPQSVRDSAAMAGVELDAIKWFFLHQANLRINLAALESLAQPQERFWTNVHKYGNTSAASVAISLGEANEQGKIQRGDLISLAAFGAGFTWGAITLKW
jgi:3-oxoacyl-[acyl-carrier-protein] synthase III